MTNHDIFNFKDYDIIDKSYTPVNTDEEWTHTKIFGLLFTASWCPPCKLFEESLAVFYHDINSKLDTGGKGFEIIHVASEKTKADFKESIQKLDWVFLRYDDKLIHMIAEELNVECIPALYIFSDKGKLLSSDGRKDITTLSTKDVWETWIKLYWNLHPNEIA